MFAELAPIARENTALCAMIVNYFRSAMGFVDDEFAKVVMLDRDRPKGLYVAPDSLKGFPTLRCSVAFQRAIAAFLAISDRFATINFSARTKPLKAIRAAKVDRRGILAVVGRISLL